MMRVCTMKTYGTKIVRLALPAPLINVGCKFACSFPATTAWESYSRLGTTLNQVARGILGIFEEVKHLQRTFLWKYSEFQ